MSRLASLLLMLSLVGCSANDPADGNASTVNEVDAMNAAADMLDTSADSLSMPANATLDSESGNGL